MRVSGSKRLSIDPREEKALARMANDVENGDMSDGGASSDSPEEISAEAFKIGGGGLRRSRSGSPWETNMMGYPTPRNYSPHLYKFAWAQAVQNKPLGFTVCSAGAVEPAKEEPSNASAGGGEERQDDGEKEEGELEEGEIELGSEPPPDVIDDSLASEKLVDRVEEPVVVVVDDEYGMGEFDNHVSLILEELETVTEQEVEKSFEDSCSRLRKCFESLKLMFTDERPPVVDALVQQAFMGIQTVHSVYSSWSSERIKQAKPLFLRLLVHIKNQYHELLEPDQMKEIDDVVHSLAFNDSEESMSHGKTVISSRSSNSFEKPISYPRELGSEANNFARPAVSKLELPAVPRSRVEFSGMLDPHAKYDVDSLPSPTRESFPSFPKPPPMENETEAFVFSQPVLSKSVDTDALNAVATYQQRHFKTNIHANRVSSPTPSENGRDEISIYKVTSNPIALNAENSEVGTSCSGSLSVAVASLSSPIKAAPLSGLPSNQFKKPTKSRDPRLKIAQPNALDRNAHTVHRYINVPENGHVGAALNPGKQRANEDSVINELSLKRPRIASADSPGIHVSSGRGGWLEETSSMAFHVNKEFHRDVKNDVEFGKPGNGLVMSMGRPGSNINVSEPNVGSEPQNTFATAGSSLSLPSLFQNIAVNPTLLMQLIAEQQKMATGTQQGTSESPQISNICKSPSVAPSGCGIPSNSSEIVENQAGKSQIPTVVFPSQNSQNDIATVRMKPRDPRRVLHNNNIPKNEDLTAEQIKSTAPVDQVKDWSAVQERGEQAQTIVLPSQAKSDIAGQFTKNLRSIADLMTSSQLNTTQPVGPTQGPPQPDLKTINKIVTRPMSTESNDQKPSSGLSREGGNAGLFQSSNAWGDMDRLLDGYDEQQKAAIQKERARRMEEQNKMFSSRKLCLVLDLDHTLLNSAKFVEVELAHDDILRKKEEQDREKPLRHLFRFQHMGMWTKLRPGIWNFLDRASKLFELHLYTMGNKLYATEMAKVLDPTGSLFAGRVISRGDDTDSLDGDDRVPKSKDLDGVLGMESAVVIVDDSVRVWPHNKLNLIVVERYTYFPCSRRQFGLLGPSLLEIDHDERPEDGTLASSLAVIERIHQIFFSHHTLNNVDVRNILAAEQRKILAGCRIVFSRVFPVGEANPHLHPLWQTAEQFGAVCRNQIDEQVTHVVANSLGTDKVNWALSTGRFVVHPGWVEASALLYRRASEHDFAVK